MSDVVILNGEIIPNNDPRAIAYRRQQNIYQSSQQYRDSLNNNNNNNSHVTSSSSSERLIDDDNSYINSNDTYSSWQQIRQDPFATTMVGCFLCLALFLILFLIWLFVMELRVGIWNLQHHIPCDKPFAIYLIGEALTSLCLFIVTLWFSLLVYRYRDQNIDEINRFELIMLIWCTLMLLLFSFVWLIFGNIWLFTSKTCKDTSKDQIPSPKPLMYSAYDAMSLVILINDMTLIFKLLDWCIRRMVRQYENPREDYMPSLTERAAANMIFTPSGMWHWINLSQGQQQQQQQRSNAFSGHGHAVGSRQDYPDI